MKVGKQAAYPAIAMLSPSRDHPGVSQETQKGYLRGQNHNHDRDRNGPATGDPARWLAGQVLEAIHILIERPEVPCPSSIAQLLDVQPGATSMPLRELVKCGLVYKGDKIGRRQPYYPKPQDSTRKEVIAK